MKKINSNGYGHKIIGAAALFLIGVPLFFYILEFLLPVSLNFWIYLSLVIGFLIILFLIVLLSIEFYQDRKINSEYTRIKKMKIPLGNGEYERQSCGNTHVKSTDKICGVCGTSFELKK